MPRVNSSTKSKPTLKEMNAEIVRYKTYLLTNKGRLTEINLCSADDYNHNKMQLHHFILFRDYLRNKEWFDENGIEQKLILMPITVHEQVHQQAVKNLSDDEFLYRYGISRWDLLFSRKNSRY